MAQHLLTETKLRTRKPGHIDLTLSDGGGLIARCRGRNVTFFYRYQRPADGRAAKISLGSYPELSLGEAREQRNALRKTLAAGMDPQHVRQDEQNRMRSELHERLSRVSLRDTYDDWDQLYLQLHRNAAGCTETLRRWKREVFPEIGDRALPDIQKPHINAVLNRARKRNAPVMVGHLLSDLRQFFEWAIGRGLVSHNPTSGIKKKNVAGPRRTRERNLSFDEIRVLLNDRLPKSGLGASSVNAIRILLGTGCRVSELLLAKWSEVDLVNDSWRLPTSKSKRPHVIHLSTFTKRAFENLGKIDGTVYVFPARGDLKALADKKRLTKQVSDRQCAEPLTNRTQTKNRALVLPGGQWSPHDLRRTMASRLADMEVDFVVIELMLNHELQGVAKVYQRSERMKERAGAFQKWGTALEQLEERSSC